MKRNSIKTKKRNPRKKKQDYYGFASVFRKKRSIKRKQRGGNKKQLSVMTFNLEIFLELYQFTMNGNTIVDKTRIEDKFETLNKLFDDVDVLCTQENVVAWDGINETIFYPNLGPLTIRSLCYSHPLGWPKSKFLYTDHSFLANAIYTSDDVVYDTTKPFISCNTDACKINTSDQDLRRCYTILTLKLENKPIKVASVHLTGGRFDDQMKMVDVAKGNASAKKRVDEKIEQVKTMIEKDHPDIICGDFNTKEKTPHSMDPTKKYAESIYLSLQSNPEYSMYFTHPEDKERIVRDFDDHWMFMDDLESFLNSQGYISVYHGEDIDTTAFGGIVDYIFYRPDKVKMIENTLEVVGQELVMKKMSENLYTNILSDHFPVRASFTLV